VPLCPPQTSHAARTRTRAAAVGNQRLTDLATARHTTVVMKNSIFCELTPRSALLATFFKFWFVRLLALRPLLAYCASLGR
jgi:hypothetical protein